MIQPCNNGQVPTRCARPCTPTCDDPNPFCLKRCDRQKRCQCPKGTVQKSIADETCVPLAQCTTFKEVPKVPSNYKSCIL